jgi:hypothetical protein
VVAVAADFASLLHAANTIAATAHTPIRLKWFCKTLPFGQVRDRASEGTKCRRYRVKNPQPRTPVCFAGGVGEFAALVRTATATFAGVNPFATACSIDRVAEASVDMTLWDGNTLVAYATQTSFFTFLTET